MTPGDDTIWPIQKSVSSISMHKFMYRFGHGEFSRPNKAMESPSMGSPVNFMEGRSFPISFTGYVLAKMVVTYILV